MNQQPTTGRIVHFVLPTDSPRKGEHRAAIITGATEGSTNVNINVFFDQTDDLPGVPVFHTVGRVWSAKYDETALPGTWHWPEPAPAPKPEVVDSMPEQPAPGHQVTPSGFVTKTATGHTV